MLTQYAIKYDASNQLFDLRKAHIESLNNER